MNKIYLRRLRRYKYQLTEDYLMAVPFGSKEISIIATHFITLIPQDFGSDSIDRLWGNLLIKRGYAWDGPSGPTIDTRSFLRGSLVHDVLYQLMREGHFPQNYRKYADDLLRQICLEDGMNKFRAWYVWKNCRLFGERSAKLRKEPRNKIMEVP